MEIAAKNILFILSIHLFNPGVLSSTIWYLADYLEKKQIKQTRYHHLYPPRCHNVLATN